MPVTPVQAHVQKRAEEVRGQGHMMFGKFGSLLVPRCSQDTQQTEIYVGQCWTLLFADQSMLTRIRASNFKINWNAQVDRIFWQKEGNLSFIWIFSRIPKVQTVQIESQFYCKKCYSTSHADLLTIACSPVPFPIQTTPSAAYRTHHHHYDIGIVLAAHARHSSICNTVHSTVHPGTSWIAPSP